MPLFLAATLHPMQTLFKQHGLTTECASTGNGIASVQIGQKSPSFLSCP